MRFGYNTNGFAHHRLEDALCVLAGIGYRSVAITLDYHALNPYAADLPRQLDGVKKQLGDLNLGCVIETGARFLLDPWRKHQPTLVSPDPARREHRLDFLRKSVDIAEYLGAECVSFWSGTPTDDNLDRHFGRLVEGCQTLAEYAAGRGVRLGFEPEPGMLIDTMARFAALVKAVDRPNFGLTLDIGHLQCLGEFPIADHILRWKDLLWNVHIEDMRRGVHDHLMFGEGDVNFRPVVGALEEIGYAGGVHVELSRHSHEAVETARRSFEFLRAVEEGQPDSCAR